MKTIVKKKGSMVDYYSYIKDMSKSLRVKQIADLGLISLINSTPKDTGETASSWRYDITTTEKGFKINYYNDNRAGDTPVVILLHYGHGTSDGFYIDGTDFINPALDETFSAFSLLKK